MSRNEGKSSLEETGLEGDRVLYLDFILRGAFLSIASYCRVPVWVSS